MREKVYMVFISYRRHHGGVFAELLWEKLIKNGFTVFLDHRNLTSGRFDIEIQEAIDEASDFVVLFSQDCFVPHGIPDYFFEEIKYALAKRKRIIPILFSDYTEPHDLPEEIAAVTKYEGVSQGSVQNIDTVFLPKLISFFSESEEKRRYYNNLNKSFLSSRKELEMESLETRWSGAVEIDICSYYANMLITSDYINQALANGVHIRYIIVDPKSFAAEEALKYKLKRANLKLWECSVDVAHDLMNSLQKGRENCSNDPISNGEFDMKITTLQINQAIMIIKKKRKEENSVKVDFYSFNTDDTQRRSILISALDKDNYDFFCEQYEYIWNAPETKSFET